MWSSQPNSPVSRSSPKGDATVRGVVGAAVAVGATVGEVQDVPGFAHRVVVAGRADLADQPAPEVVHVEFDVVDHAAVVRVLCPEERLVVARGPLARIVEHVRPVVGRVRAAVAAAQAVASCLPRRGRVLEALQPDDRVGARFPERTAVAVVLGQERAGGEIATREPQVQDLGGHVVEVACGVLTFDLQEPANEAGAVGLDVVRARRAGHRERRAPGRQDVGLRGDVAVPHGLHPGDGGERDWLDGGVHGRQVHDVVAGVRQQDPQAGHVEEALRRHGWRVWSSRAGPADDVDRLGSVTHQRQVEPACAGATVGDVPVVRPDREVRPGRLVLSRGRRTDDAALAGGARAVERAEEAEGAGTGVQRHPHVALVRAGDAVLQVRPDDLTDGSDAIGQRQGRGPVLLQEEVRVGVDAAAEIEVGTREERQVVLREDAELEDRDADGLHLTTHPHLAARDGSRGDGDFVRRDQTNQTLIGTRRDRTRGRRACRNAVARPAARRRVLEAIEDRRVGLEAIELAAGRTEVPSDEQIAEIGRQLLEPRMRRGIRLRLVAIEPAGLLVGHDEGDEPDQQGRHEHHDHDGRHEGHALFPAPSFGLHLRDFHERTHMYRLTSARLRRLTCVASVFR